MKNTLKENKYLIHSFVIFAATLIAIAFATESISQFFSKLSNVLEQSLSAVASIFILFLISGWLLFPLVPKSEDFTDDEKRDAYFSTLRWDVLLLIFMVILFTITFGFGA